MADELLADADPEMRRDKLLKRNKSALTLHIVFTSSIILPGWEEKKGEVVNTRRKNERQSEDDLITAIYSILDLASEERERKDLKKDRPWLTTP